MRSLVCLAIILGIFGVVFAAADEPTTAPTSQPTTQPALTFSVRGRVQRPADLDLAGIDLGRVVVYLDSEPTLDALSPPLKTATMAQENKAFVPNLLVVAKGTPVEFPNWDHIYHNVFSRSAAAPAFDLDRYPYGWSKTRTFDKIGIVQLFCNIHPSMRAIVFVTPNKFFCRADGDGNFQIDGIPPGHYQIVAWQERCVEEPVAIDVGPGAAGDLSLLLQETRDAILANDPPRHAEGYGIDRGLGVKRERLNLPVVKESHPALTTEPSN